MNKRGSLPDTIAGPIFLLVLGFTMYLGYYIFDIVSTNMQGLSQDTATNNLVASMIIDMRLAFNSFDYMVPFIIGGLLMVSLVFAYKRGASVIYIGLSLIFWVLALMLSAVFTNIFTEFSSNFTGISSNFVILNWVFLNLKWIVLAWLFLLGIVMFSRNKREEQQLASAESVFMQ